MTPLRQFLAATVLFAALTALMTWPQVAYLGTRATEHQDVYFNMWRLEWFAHALRTAPSTLLDGNIFYPERRTLTFSDAMPVEGLVAAPMLWARARPVLVHNLVLLAGLVFSAAGVFVLAHHLTANTLAAVVAGIIFAFVPYRFDHYMHMELQWTVWIPWALWAMHRTCETGERRYGLMTGAFVALQMLSSIYYGMFLATLLVVAGVPLLWPGHVTERDGPRPTFRRAATSLVAGAALAIVICLVYALPYLRTKSQVGGRPADQILAFSASPRSYLAATHTNLLYGERDRPSDTPERRLFPGTLALVLAVLGLVARRRPYEALVYLLMLVVAFEMSLGPNGFTYAFLHRHIPAYEGLRALARLGIFVTFALAILAAYGVARLPLRSAAGKLAVAIVLPAALLLEYWVAPLSFVPYPNAAPEIYAWLARMPVGVVAEFPMPRIKTLPGADPKYTYMSTFHWMPTVNGYSGYYPVSYFRRIEGLQSFPDDETIARLQREHVRYVIVHESAYPPGRGRQVIDFLVSEPRFSPIITASDGEGAAMLLELHQ